MARWMRALAVSNETGRGVCASSSACSPATFQIGMPLDEYCSLFEETMSAFSGMEPRWTKPRLPEPLDVSGYFGGPSVHLQIEAKLLATTVQLYPP